ncbi:hypothetical protein Tco_0676661 [Tanacetum coccineum]
MAQLKYCDKHNQVGFLRKPDESAGFAEIVDFLRGSNLRYALTSNPTIYDSLVKQFWQTATAKTLADGTLELHATIDTIVYTITEASIRNKLQLADASGITMLPNNEIFEGMGHMGSKNILSVAQSHPSSSHNSRTPVIIHLHLPHQLVKKVRNWKVLLEEEKRNVVLLDSMKRKEHEDQGRLREEQVKDISPNTLEVAKTLSRVASQKPKSIDKGRNGGVGLVKLFRVVTIGKEEEFEEVKRKDVVKLGKAVYQEDWKEEEIDSRKGLHSEKTDEDESEASKDTDPISAMLKDITRDDLTELYRIVMNRYGMNGPEDELEKVNKEHKLEILLLPAERYVKLWLDKKLQEENHPPCLTDIRSLVVQEQTALGKDFSNPLMADNLPKMYDFNSHIWLVVRLASPHVYGFVVKGLWEKPIT